jgi:hypothetical protein
LKGLVLDLRGPINVQSQFSETIQALPSSAVDRNEVFSCSSFAVHKVPFEEFDGERQPMPTTAVAKDFGKSRKWVIVEAGSAMTCRELFDHLAGMAGVVAAMSSQFESGVAAIVLKGMHGRLNHLREGLKVSALSARHDDESLRVFLTAFEKCPRARNFDTEYIQKDAANLDIPTMQEMETWLTERSDENFHRLAGNARRAIQMKIHDRFQHALIKVMPSECKEFVEEMAVANAGVKLVGGSARVFPTDFREGVLDLVGTLWNHGMH